MYIAQDGKLDELIELYKKNCLSLTQVMLHFG